MGGDFIASPRNTFVTSGWSGKQQRGLWLSIIFGLHLKVLTNDAEVQGFSKTCYKVCEE